MTNTPHQTGMRLYGRHGKRLYLADDEAVRFLAVASTRRPDISLFSRILFHTGVRLSEARAIAKSDIQADAGVIAIRTLKQRNEGHVRELHVPSVLATELAVYCRRFGQDQRLFPVERSTAWRWITAIMAEADIAGAQASPKGLRHGFGVRAVMAGVPLPVLQKWMGHARLETTTIYTRILGREERRLAEAMFDGWDV